MKQDKNVFVILDEAGNLLENFDGFGNGDGSTIMVADSPDSFNAIIGENPGYMVVPATLSIPLLGK